MRIALADRARALRRLLRDESGQAMTEYVGVTTLLLFSTIAAGSMFPVAQVVFRGLQFYIDFYFFCLNLAVG